MAASLLFEGIAQSGFGATLDFSKCFDSMTPVGTVALMELAGFPKDLCGFCQAVWGTQQRFVVWQNAVHPEPVSAQQATVQGCPFSPLALALWMAAGVRAVAAQVPNQEGAGAEPTKVYMDDRSFAASSAPRLLDKVQAWAAWSQSVGLSENQAKLQLAATSNGGLQELRHFAEDPERVSTNFEVLGVCARFRPRTNSAKEEQRMSSAVRVVTILGLLRLPFDRFQQSARCFGTSKVSYGWIARTPPQKTSWRLWAAIR